MQCADPRLTIGPFDHPVRGLLHGTGAVLWLSLAASVVGGRCPGRAAVLLCACSHAALFATSALYHSLPWRPRWKARMQRADHAMIHVNIASTVTALTWLAGPAPWTATVVGGAWAVTAAVVAYKAWGPPIPDHPSIHLQLGQALLGVPALVTFAGRGAAGELALLLGGTLLHLAGGLCFATRRPVLWPRVFSFHEVFHACVLAGSGAYFALLSSVLAGVP
jgi:hemolysin III